MLTHPSADWTKNPNWYKLKNKCCCPISHIFYNQKSIKLYKKNSVNCAHAQAVERDIISNFFTFSYAYFLQFFPFSPIIPRLIKLFYPIFHCSRIRVQWFQLFFRNSICFMCTICRCLVSVYKSIVYDNVLPYRTENRVFYSFFFFCLALKF